MRFTCFKHKRPCIILFFIQYVLIKMIGLKKNMFIFDIVLNNLFLDTSIFHQCTFDQIAYFPVCFFLFFRFSLYRTKHLFYTAFKIIFWNIFRKPYLKIEVRVFRILNIHMYKRVIMNFNCILLF